MKKKECGAFDQAKKTNQTPRKRPGPKQKYTHACLFRLTDEQHQKMRELGGSKWLQALMNQMIERDKLAKEKNNSL